MKVMQRHFMLFTSIVFILLLSFGVGTVPVHAQSDITLSEMSAAIWPEYDKPGVLVIYNGTLSPDVRLPVEIIFAIPASIGGPSATAGVDDQGSFRYRQYQMVLQDDELLVSYNLPYRRFQFEYYYDPITGQGQDRLFDFTYRADYAVEAFTFEVQEPTGSVDFSTIPPAGSTVTEGQLPLRVIDIGPLDAGASAGVTVSYRKEGTRLSAEIIGVPTPSSVQFEDAPRQGVETQTLIIIVAVAAIILTIVGLAIWSRSRQRAFRSRQVRRHTARKSGTKPAAQPPQRLKRERVAQHTDSAPVTGYCHQCGRALKKDETFCPGCGTRRKEN